MSDIWTELGKLCEFTQRVDYSCIILAAILNQPIGDGLIQFHHTLLSSDPDPPGPFDLALRSTNR